MSKRKPQIEQIVFVLFIGFFLLYIYVLCHQSQKLFCLIIRENQSFKIPTVNFSSTENNSANDVAFSQAKTAEVASFS